jgi:hypothetical protein
MENYKHDVLFDPYPNYFKPKLINKSQGHKLSKNEKFILDMIPEQGLELGRVSNALLFSKPLENLTKQQRNALYNLIYNDEVYYVKNSFKSDLLVKIRIQ